MLALSFLSLSYVASAAQPAGKLVSSTGQVQATDPSKISRTLKVGDAVFAGEALKSDPSAAAKFLMTDQTILDLNPGSELLVDYYDLRSGGDRVVQISVNQGKIRASVNKAISGAGSFKIKTHTMVMGVRGTEFVVQDSSRGNQSQLTVMKGLVQVAPTAGGSSLISVEPGNQLTAPVGAAPQLVKLSPDQLAAVVKGATVRDSTFGMSVEISKSGGKASSAATDSALTTAKGSTVASGASLTNKSVIDTIPGNTSSDLSVKTAALPLAAGQTVKVNVKFTP